MSDWVTVCKASEIIQGDWYEFELNDRMLLAINLAGSFHVIEDLCTHDGGTLADGFIEDNCIVCPRHGASFCIKTGAVTAPPAYEDIETFPVRVVDGLLQVKNVD